MTAVGTVRRPLPKARRGTWTFLHEGARDTCHVHLGAEVDATEMIEARRASSSAIGFTAMLIQAAAKTAMKFPAARMLLQSSLLGPRIIEIPDVNVKLLVDRTLNDVRCVLPCTLMAAQDLSVAEIQAFIDEHRTAPLDGSGPFAAVLRLQQLPIPLQRLVYRIAMHRSALRAQIQGTFSVTTVGQQAVSFIHPMISGTLGFGMGQIRQTPIAVDTDIALAPCFTLTLAFDHRVIDGAEAATVLAEVKALLEGGSLL